MGKIFDKLEVLLYLCGVENNKQTSVEWFYEQIDQNNPVTRGSTALVKISKLTSAQTSVKWFNHEVWEYCCGIWFDKRNEEFCPKCGNK